MRFTHEIKNNACFNFWESIKNSVIIPGKLSFVTISDFIMDFTWKSAGFLMISWNLTKDQISGKFTTVTIVMTVHASVKLSYFYVWQSRTALLLGQHRKCQNYKSEQPETTDLPMRSYLVYRGVSNPPRDSKKCFTVSDPPTGVRYQETPHFELPFRSSSTWYIMQNWGAVQQPLKGEVELKGAMECQTRSIQKLIQPYQWVQNPEIKPWS